MPLLSFEQRLLPPTKGILILIGIWCIIQVLVSQAFPLRTSVDTPVFVESATNILHGRWPAGRDIFYISYSLLLAIPLGLGLEPTAIIWLQFGFAIIAIVSIYKMVLLLNGNLQAAFLAGMFYVVWYEFQQWNLIVYSDALFTSLAITSSFVLLRYQKRKSLPLTAILLLFTIFVRPTGFGILMAALAFFTHRLWKNSTKSSFLKMSYLILTFLFSCLIITFFLKGAIDSFIESYKAAEIIYPKINWLIDPPESFNDPGPNVSPLMRWILIWLKNPVYMIKLSMTKGVLFLAHVKPYYSTFHNLMIAGFLYPMYFFGMKGLKNLPKSPIKTYLLTFVSVQIVTVAMTSENWDGRFLLPVLPFIFVLAALGILSQNPRQSQ